MSLDDYILPDKAPEPPREESQQASLRSSTFSLDTGLPANIDAERTILGACLLENAAFREAAMGIEPEDFSLDSHRRIFSAMGSLIGSNHVIDLVTLSHELARCKEIDTVGGVSYLASLTEGLPRRPIIDEYIRIVKDKSMLRQLMMVSSATIAQAADQSDTAFEILNNLELQLVNLADRFRSRTAIPFFLGYRSFVETAPDEILWTVEGLIQKEGNGLILGDSGTSKSVLVFDLAVHLVAGVAWFQHRIPHRVRVGLVAREDAPGLSQNRLKRLVDGSSEAVRSFLDLIDLEQWLYINTRSQRETWSLQKESDIQDIIESTKERGIQILFFDVFRELWEGNENDNQETAKVLAQAKRIGREANCQVAIVHHLSKSDRGTIFDRARGGGINGWKEWGFGLTVDNPDEPDPKNWIRKIQFHSKMAASSPPIFYRIEGRENELRLEQIDSPSSQYTPSATKQKKKPQGTTQQSIGYSD